MFKKLLLIFGLAQVSTSYSLESVNAVQGICIIGITAIAGIVVSYTIYCYRVLSLLEDTRRQMEATHNQALQNLQTFQQKFQEDLLKLSGQFK